MEGNNPGPVGEALLGQEGNHAPGEDESTTYVPRPTLGVVGKSDYVPGAPQPEDETASASDLMSDFVTEISPEEGKMAPGPSENLDEPLVEQLLPPIEAAWNKTVQGLFEVGSLLKQAPD